MEGGQEQGTSGMKIVRSSKCSIKFTTQKKKDELQTILNRKLTIRDYDTVMIELSNHITQEKSKGKSG